MPFLAHFYGQFAGNRPKTRAQIETELRMQQNANVAKRKVLQRAARWTLAIICPLCLCLLQPGGGAFREWWVLRGAIEWPIRGTSIPLRRARKPMACECGTLGGRCFMRSGERTQKSENTNPSKRKRKKGKHKH